MSKSPNSFRQSLRRRAMLAASATGLATFNVAQAADAQSSAPMGNADSKPADNAQDTAAIADIIVTAERRSQRLQDVPISITAVRDLRSPPRASPTRRSFPK